MKRAAATFILSLSVVGLAPRLGHACMNAVREVDEVVATVQATERLLDEGDPDAALARARPLLEELVMREALVAGTSDLGLMDRLRRVVALADVRLASPAARDHEVRAKVRAAVEELRRLDDLRPNDPTKQTDLGEALAVVDPDASRAILEPLASRDLVTTPYGYIALARRRDDAGDPKGRDLAIERCEGMAKTPAICRLRPWSRAWTLAFGIFVSVDLVLAVAFAPRLLQALRERHAL